LLVGLKALVRRAVDRRVYTVRRGVAKGLRRRGGLGFLPERRPTPEVQYLRSLQLQGATIYDVGAHEGVMSAFFARAALPDGGVVSFEPNPHSAERMRDNLALNGIGNVRIVPIALGASPSVGVLAVPSWEPGRGSLALRHERRDRTTPVRIDALDRLRRDLGLPPPTFVKIDVEGFEGDVLDGMSETLRVYRPRLAIELHGIGAEQKRANAQRVVKTLAQAGYRIRHVETGADVDANSVPLEGHVDATPAERTTPSGG
jgi:FkbM family methyltransferase